LCYIAIRRRVSFYNIFITNKLLSHGSSETSAKIGSTKNARKSATYRHFFSAVREGNEPLYHAIYQCLTTSISTTHEITHILLSAFNSLIFKLTNNKTRKQYWKFRINNTNEFNSTNVRKKRTSSFEGMQNNYQQI